MADEKVVLPRNKPLESLRFLSFKSFRGPGRRSGDDLALSPASAGDSVYMDLNNDEDLGNDGPGRFWPKGDSCVPLSGVAAVRRRFPCAAPEPRPSAWKAECEGMKSP